MNLVAPSMPLSKAMFAVMGGCSRPSISGRKPQIGIEISGASLLAR
jgi:hypothetical protein